MSRRSQFKRIAIALVAASLLQGLGPPLFGAQEEASKFVERTYEIGLLMRDFGTEARSIEPMGKLVYQLEASRAPQAKLLFEDLGWPRVNPSQQPQGIPLKPAQQINTMEDFFEALQGLRGWSGEGTCVILPGRRFLRVVQPAAVQDQVASILDALQARALLRARIECLLVPLEILEAAVPLWRAEAPYIPDAAFLKLLGNPQARLATAMTWQGQTALFGEQKRQTFVWDYEVNQTGVIPVANAVIELIPGGDRIEARTLISPDRSAVRLDLVIQRRELDSRTEKPFNIYGEFRLPRSSETTLWTSVLVPRGKALIASGISGEMAQGGARGLVAIIRAIPSGPEIGQAEKAPPREDEKTALELFDLPVGLIPPLEEPLFSGGLSSSEAGSDAEVLESFRGLLLEEGSRRVGESAAENSWIGILPWGNTMAVMGSRPLRRFAGEFVRSRETPSALAFVDLRILTVPRPGFAALLGQTEDGVTFKEGWQDALKAAAPELRCLLSGFAGQLLSARHARIDSIVTNALLVSGGTGFSILSIADPIVEQVGSGYALEARASELPGKGEVALECVCIFADTDTSAKQEILTPLINSEGPSGQAAPEGGRPAAPTTAKSSEQVLKGTLTLPRQKILTWRGQAVVPADRDVLLDVAGGGEEVRVLIGSARIVKQ